MPKTNSDVLLTVPGSLSRYANGNAFIMPITFIQFTPEGIHLKPLFKFLSINMLTRFNYNWKLLPYAQISRTESYNGEIYKSNTFRIITDLVNESCNFSVGYVQSETIPLLRELVDTCSQDKGFSQRAEVIATQLRSHLLRSQLLYRNFTLILMALACAIMFTPYRLISFILLVVGIMLSKICENRIAIVTGLTEYAPTRD